MGWQSFQHSKDLLRNRSRAGVLATKELKETQPGVLHFGVRANILYALGSAEKERDVRSPSASKS